MNTIEGTLWELLTSTSNWEMFPGAKALAETMMAHEESLITITREEYEALRECEVYVRAVAARLGGLSGISGHPDPDVAECLRLAEKVDRARGGK